MSYDIELTDPVTGDTLELDSPHHMRGGTYQVGGTSRAHLNVTYNYGTHFRRTFGHDGIPLDDWQRMFGGGETGIRSIYGMTGAASIPVLRQAASKLGDDVDSDYWRPTEGNAKRALMQLIALAEMRPDGIWQGD
jgi:hypothetical protein